MQVSVRLANLAFEFVQCASQPAFHPTHILGHFRHGRLNDGLDLGRRRRLGHLGLLTG